MPVLTDHDVLAGTAPLRDAPGERGGGGAHRAGRRRAAPCSAAGAVARVVDEATAGAVARPGTSCCCGPDPAALDAWFLAGFLRGTANHRRAGSYASTAARLDVRRLQVPRASPRDEQRRYGERFRALDEFERALRAGGRLGEQLVRGMYDGLADGHDRPRLTAAQLRYGNGSVHHGTGCRPAADTLGPSTGVHTSATPVQEQHVRPRRGAAPTQLGTVITQRVLYAASGAVVLRDAVPAVPLFRDRVLRGRALDWIAAWASMPLAIACMA
ncbi:hypothetical protein GCM10019016_062860 [Streptomyces prasinosporus]|uniref:Uncharacterized protein n=1 Tax=Streptomyces prasinosporus TaxID=68256 RepID=A0ABP6TXI7_9ACTN